jgi:hypothetical protein
MFRFKAIALLVAIAMIGVLSACQSGAQGVPSTSAQQGFDVKQRPGGIYPEALPGPQFGAAAASTQQNGAATNADYLPHYIVPPPAEDGCYYTQTKSGIPCICWSIEGSTGCYCKAGSLAEPEGMTGVRNGKLFYVGLAAETVIVLKYAKNEWTQIATMTGLNGNPVGMATDSRGDLWVTNSPTTTISEFAKGTTTPIASYTDANLNSVNYLTVDKKNNVYVEGYSGSAMEIDELTASGTFTAIAKPGQVGTTPGGLAVQEHTTATYMWINDQGSGSGTGRISRYLLKGGSLKSTGSFSYSGIDGAIAVDPSGKDTGDVYATDNVVSGSQYTGTTVEYAFPSGKVRYYWGAYTLPYEGVAVAVLNKL